MKSKSLKFRLLSGTFSFFLILVFSSCFGGGANPFAKDDGEVEENIENLMGLSVGMTKGQVFELAGVANMIEGYDWGSVWRYKIRKGAKEGTLANSDVENSLMPVVFDNTDRVMGYGTKFYEQTISDLGSGQF